MGRTKQIPHVEIIIREDTPVHSGLKELQKIIASDSAKFEFVSITLFLNGDTNHDRDEVYKAVDHLMKTFHYKIGKEIEDNKEYKDGYYLSRAIQRLNEIKTVNEWMKPIGEYSRDPEYKSKQ